MLCYGGNYILGAVSSIQHTWPFVQTINNPLKSVSVNHLSSLKVVGIASSELFLTFKTAKFSSNNEAFLLNKRFHVPYILIADVNRLMFKRVGLRAQS